MLPPGERERLAAEIGKRHVGGQPQLAGESLEADMIRALQCDGPRFGPAQPRLATHDDARRAFDRLDDPHQLRRAGTCGRTAGSAARNRSRGRNLCAVRNVVSRILVFWQIALGLRLPRRPGRRGSSRHPGIEQSVENTGSESKRGRQHQTIAPLLCISAENWQFPISSEVFESHISHLSRRSVNMLIME